MVVLNYRLLGFETWNLIEFDCVIYHDRSAVFYTANGGRFSYVTSADIFQNLWPLILEDQNIFLHVRIFNYVKVEMFTLIFIGVHFVCCRSSYEEILSDKIAILMCVCGNFTRNA